MGFATGSVVKNLAAMQEIQIQSLGQEDPLEENMANQCSILAWKIPWTEEPGSPWGCKESNTSEVTEQYIHTYIYTYIYIYIYNIHKYIYAYMK